ncbi:MAG: helix-turn-helix domain-containing protein [OCS116 cluster bacterium]|uniref:IclR family transcriptional regulator n=1 Tax=OCS116 cluster bacterium TaxID=2030921 RepID=A0A2A4Z1D6_9PROT|nr:helix-turn-helix domain-containing protein [OCS116 cluster bacterium]
MTGLNRFINIIRLFDENQGEWTIPEMAESLEAPTSTIYRNVRELSKAGFLESAPSSRYRLGPAFVEFNRRFQLTDPLMRTGSKFLTSLISHVPAPSVVALSRLYDNQVMCTITQQSPNIKFSTSYQKGHPMPLIKGATSKVILASLKPKRLNELLNQQFKDSENDANKKQFLMQLKEINQKGYCVTRGEVDDGLVGLAAPIVSEKHNIFASLSIISDGNLLQYEDENQILPLLTSTAKIIGNNLAE